ncbi:hypothetical protein DERP_012414 [Dermatophagoides pteronyssinus]|uniref:Uncharacterized protein n=1 Tax=Dermatophagoides pteronyssinus TaxID=6956 RepID=A0ABQ8IUN3_DERPT|nr:hypothetical protein DERP_012414 [Dermatophagoides pteronyssinus]
MKKIKKIKKPKVTEELISLKPSDEPIIEESIEEEIKPEDEFKIDAETKKKILKKPKRKESVTEIPETEEKDVIEDIKTRNLRGNYRFAR